MRYCAAHVSTCTDRTISSVLMVPPPSDCMARLKPVLSSALGLAAYRSGAHRRRTDTVAVAAGGLLPRWLRLRRLRQLGLPTVLSGATPLAYAKNRKRPAMERVMEHVVHVDERELI